ncbi:DUF2304 domain-containing protein [Dermabacteraceae bacterium TAE3-ERU5]|nr:DUF2304 domain-containing protein [Dermabacteraceae bacterium TAE3-ERU5]
MNFLTALPLGPVLLAEGATGGQGSRTLIIQVLLILSILGIAAWLFKKRGAKQLAIRRLIIIAFVCFAVVTVMFPSLLSALAALVGVGRGTDLLLYATVVVLLGFLALQEARTKNQEKRTTYLARRLALDDAEQPAQVRERALGTPQ